jgi:hypothetical protein
MTPEFYCHITGATVVPLGVGTPETVRGVRYAWFRCPACDTSDRRRSDAGFDATQPGKHVVFFDPIPSARVWRSRYPWSGRQPQ